MTQYNTYITTMHCQLMKFYDVRCRLWGAGKQNILNLVSLFVTKTAVKKL